MKTDLKKILSISGQPGLFLYCAQAKAGVVVESLNTKRRTCCGMSARLTSLDDISIYTETEEIRLKALFEAMKSKLGEEAAPKTKSEPKVLISFFEEVLPTYDKDKFFVHHMQKVVSWYNILREFATLEFVDHEQEGAETEEKANEA